MGNLPIMVIPDKAIRYNELTQKYWVYLPFRFDSDYRWVGTKDTLKEAQQFYIDTYQKVFSQ